MLRPFPRDGDALLARRHLRGEVGPDADDGAPGHGDELQADDGHEVPHFPAQPFEHRVRVGMQVKRFAEAEKPPEILIRTDEAVHAVVAGLRPIAAGNALAERGHLGADGVEETERAGGRQPVRPGPEDSVTERPPPGPDGHDDGIAGRRVPGLAVERVPADDVGQGDVSGPRGETGRARQGPEELVVAAVPGRHPLAVLPDEEDPQVGLEEPGELGRHAGESRLGGRSPREPFRDAPHQPRFRVPVSRPSHAGPPPSGIQTV